MLRVFTITAIFSVVTITYSDSSSTNSCMKHATSVLGAKSVSATNVGNNPTDETCTRISGEDTLQLSIPITQPTAKCQGPSREH
jgi:hypothetical protein